MIVLRWLIVFLIGWTVIESSRIVGQGDKKEKVKPQLLVAMPLGAMTGKTTRLILPGLRIDKATEVKVMEPGFTVKIIRKNTISANNQVSPNRVGDSEVEIDLTVPGDTKANTASLVVVTPEGESVPWKLPIDRENPIMEKEPNDTFQQAQSISLPGLVLGRIEKNQDVDVFKLECVKGDKISIDVMAARLGSALDSLLLLHTSEGQLLESNDDSTPSGDSHLEVVIPKTGIYYLTILDANDHGGTAFVYRLSILKR